jgi:hypothetical protein
MPHRCIIIAEVYMNINTHMDEWYVISHALNMSPFSKNIGKKGFQMQPYCSATINKKRPDWEGNLLVQKVASEGK